MNGFVELFLLNCLIRSGFADANCLQTLQDIYFSDNVRLDLLTRASNGDDSEGLFSSLIVGISQGKG